MQNVNKKSSDISLNMKTILFSLYKISFFIYKICAQILNLRIREIYQYGQSFVLMEKLYV